MEKISAAKKQQIKDIEKELKELRAQLALAQKVAGVDDFINVKVEKNEGHFKRTRVKDGKDKAEGQYVIRIIVTAKQAAVYIPLSISSGKKTSGFMYVIEGTDEGQIVSAKVDGKGDKMTKITVGTILYTKIPAAASAEFRILTNIRGQLNHKYKVIINRINYKLDINDARYHSYIKPIVSDTVNFS